MSNKETGGPAFPFNKRPEQAFPSTFKSLDGKEQIHAWGMTLRDYFAAKAMQEIMGQAYGLEQECFTDGDFSFPDTMRSLAKEAYKWADAMMKAREA